MFVTNSKRFLIIIFLAAVSIGGILCFSVKTKFLIAPSNSPSNSAPEKKIENATKAVKDLTNQQLTKSTLQPGIENQVNKEQQWPTVMGSPANAAEIKSWFDSRGYAYWGEANNEYASYDKETLEKLAQSGDVRAMKYLGDSVYGTVGGFEKAKSAYEKAAIYGSTDALDAVGLIIETSIYSNADTPEKSKLAALEALAWYNAAALRGDKWPNINSSESFINRKKIELSEQDRLQVKERSQEIYDELLKKRKAIGLGDFDNSVPDSVKNYFETFDKR